jgi:hypothetical protein
MVFKGVFFPYLRLMDPDPDILVSDLQYVTNFFFIKFFGLLPFKGTFTSFF